MDQEKSRLAEKMILVLYALSQTTDKVNKNTYRRYIYIYYQTSAFLNNSTDNINIIVEKGDIRIIGFDEILNQFISNDYIEIRNNNIIINQELKDYIAPLLDNKQGALSELYKEIQPFVNLLQSYNDQFIFTIFFSEPTFKEAPARGIEEMSSTESKLNKLLKDFKRKLNNVRIDEYDILAYWMDYILKNYYTVEEGDSSGK